MTCLAETVPETGSDAFGNVTLSNVTLLVPEKSISAYQEKTPWKDFKEIVAFKKCATPTIAFKDGKITATSETAGAECTISGTITSSIAGTNEVAPTIKLKVTAYATAEGYVQSETAEATFDLIELLFNTGDVNGDGNIDVKDVTDLVNKVLKK